jgi:hypothetical protein
MKIIFNQMGALSRIVISVASLLSINFANAQEVVMKENCRANYMYVQGASTKVAFLNKSIGDYTFSEWNFGDGNIATSKNAVHEYKSSGYYLLRLVVSNNQTNSDTLYQIINIHNVLDPKSSYASLNRNEESSFVLSARTKEALFDCFDKFFADAILVTPSQKQKKVIVETSW